MPKEIRNRITLDSSRFVRGADAVTRHSKRMRAALGTGMRKAAVMGGRGLLAAGAAGIGAGIGLVAGIKSVINLGAELDHLKAQTGSAVAELLILKQTFEDNGVAGDNARLALNKMQKGMVEAKEGTGEALKAFDSLGLSVDTLMGLKPTEQFKMIGSAINAMEDPAERSAAAMRIFGRAGAEMQSVFGEGKIEDAAASIGRQAKLLEKNSAMFERTGTLLDRVGNKLQGFFVGVADKVVPIVLPLLERLDHLDLADQGQRFGQGIANGLKTLVGLFENNTLGAVVGESLIIAGKSFINTVARGWSAIILGVSMALVEAVKQMVTTARTNFVALATGFGKALLTAGGTLVAVLRDGFLGIASTFSGAILQALGSGIAKIPGLGGKGEALSAAGAGLSASGAERGSDALDQIKSLPGRIGAAFSGVPGLSETVGRQAAAVANAFADGVLALEGVDILDLQGNKDRLRSMLSGALATGQNIAPAAAGGSQVDAFGEGEESGLGTPASRAITGGVSNLRSIGGGGGVGASTGIETAIQTGNRLLSQVNSTLKGISNKIGGLGNGPGGLGNDPVLI